MRGRKQFVLPFWQQLDQITARQILMYEALGEPDRKVETRTEDDFIHPMKNLRVGATLANGKVLVSGGAKITLGIFSIPFSVDSVTRCELFDGDQIEFGELCVVFSSIGEPRVRKDSQPSKITDPSIVMTPAAPARRFPMGWMLVWIAVTFLTL